MKPRYLLEAGA